MALLESEYFAAVAVHAGDLKDLQLLDFASRKVPVSPHWPHILQRRLQRFVTRSWTNVGIGTGTVAADAKCAMTCRRPRRMRNA